MMETDDQKVPSEELENIDEIIEDELRRAKEARPFKQSAESKRQTEASNKISTTILEVIKTEEPPYYFSRSASEALVGMIRRANLNNYTAHSTFYHIEWTLQNLLENQSKDSVLIGFLESAIASINSTAIRYFVAYLEDEFKDVHLAEIVQRSKATLDAVSERDEKYFRLAVEAIKKGAERRIDLIKEMRLNREQMGDTEDGKEVFSLEEKEKPDDRMRRQKDRGLTRESAYLFVDYLLDYAIGKSAVKKSITKRADVVEFLTGYSSTKLKDVPAWIDKGKAKIEEFQETDEKIFKELQNIRKQFESLGLQEIVARIDADLGDIS
ncbi:MAG: hypothetical protein ABL959_01265 [Pyrinomonadaceae bacterium]